MFPVTKGFLLEIQDKVIPTRLCEVHCLITSVQIDQISDAGDNLASNGGMPSIHCDTLQGKACI